MAENLTLAQEQAVLDTAVATAVANEQAAVDAARAGPGTSDQTAQSMLDDIVELAVLERELAVSAAAAAGPMVGRIPPSL
jgi:hypothetical protein